MSRMFRNRSNRMTMFAALAVVASVVSTYGYAAMLHTSSKFEGPKANTGTVSHGMEGGKSVLTLSDDFVVPETPDPHWQLVDSKGNVYLLAKLKIKGDKVNKSIEIPSYVKDVAKVQIWCAFAEVNLGEASFSEPVR